MTRRFPISLLSLSRRLPKAMVRPSSEGITEAKSLVEVVLRNVMKSPVSRTRRFWPPRSSPKAPSIGPEPNKKYFCLYSAYFLNQDS